MEIRMMVKEDREEVFQMMRPFYDSEAILHTPSDEVLYQNIDDCVGELPFVEGYCFVEDGKIAGYSMTSISYTTEYGGLCIWIEDIYVKPEYRGRGFAGVFFAFLEKKWEKRAVRYKLEVELENERAISVYEKAGYKKLDYFIMSKEVEDGNK